ncbi:hypothetical protein TrVE_jg8170 [Triparma verrucosa]|uniref:K Homology domain-containing protein n=1 Tax=Triparma verrucosa TaxID=1606542 RepID=A0A9W7F8C1_9STRA|nr:hypothetical protein TrVE_jg8170 [Triparma verrucosa]
MRTGSKSGLATFTGNPSTSYLTFQTANLRAKQLEAVTCCSWTPGGRRLLTGNFQGEFCLWDGNTYQFELIMSAHDDPFRCMCWSPNQNFLITTSSRGNLKYWSSTIAPIVSIEAHDKCSINEVSFSPSSNKFVTGGDDRGVNVFDFETTNLERNLKGHGWDVKAAQWHPAASLIASGGKDNLVKLWDPRQGGCLSTLYGHKSTVTKVAWSPNGNWLLTGSRDQMIKMYDVRSMKELCSLKGHYKEITCLQWHPFQESVFVSGGMDGTILYWNVGPKGSEDPVARINHAHDMAVWDCKWHPSGHCMASASNDKTTKLWVRPRLGNIPVGQEWLNDLPSPFNEKEIAYEEEDIVTDEIHLGAHVGIVIGKKGSTIISMQRATGTKMHVDQARKTLEIEGTPRQLDHVKRRLSRLLERVEAQVQNQAMGFVDEKAAEMQRAMARQMERQKMAAKEAEVGARRNI